MCKEQHAEAYVKLSGQFFDIRILKISKKLLHINVTLKAEKRKTLINAKWLSFKLGIGQCQASSEQISWHFPCAYEIHINHFTSINIIILQIKITFERINFKNYKFT